MKLQHSRVPFPRRRLLRAACGAALGLPVLEALLPRGAQAQAAQAPPFLILVVQGNGVVQAGRAIDGSTDPERFWPTAPGALTTAALEADRVSRATGELSSHAAKLSVVRGIGHPFSATGCMHASGDAQTLTSSKLSGDGNKVLATGESVDTLIARALNAPGTEPLVLHAGKYGAGGTGFDIPGYVSYLGPTQPRTYLDGPYLAYQRITGVVGTGDGSQTPAVSEEQARAALRSKSINDTLRSQIQTLLSRADLSKSDRERLDQHFSAIRELEISMADSAAVIFRPSAESISAMQVIDPAPRDMAHHEKLIELHMQLMAFAVSSGYTRVAVLKIGDREDDHQFSLGGTTFVYHTASHRAVVGGADLCSQVDYLHMRYFKGLLDQMETIATPAGTLLDAGATVWTNQVANGSHSFVNVPWLLAGSAGGFLETGQFVDVPSRDYKTNRMLNTLINAAGVRAPGGALVQDFGDPELSQGLVDELIA
jgi:hypothetical protein